MNFKSLVVVGLIVAMASCAVFSTVPSASADIIVETIDQTENRALNTIYQNTTGKPMFVCVSITIDEGDGYFLKIEVASPPRILVDSILNFVGDTTLQGIVQSGWYYQLGASGPGTLLSWIEQTLEDNYLTGPQGPPGENGSRWYTGEGAASSSLGNDNDYYLENVSDNVYEKVGGSWVYVANIKGLPGSGGGGVTSIIAGDNITISPITGLGDVTINASGDGTTIVSGGGGDWRNWLRDGLIWLGEGGRFWLGIIALLVSLCVICWVFLRDD